MKSLLDVYFSFYTEDPHCWGGAAAPGRPPRSPSPNTPARACSVVWCYGVAQGASRRRRPNPGPPCSPSRTSGRLSGQAPRTRVCGILYPPEEVSCIRRPDCVCSARRPCLGPVLSCVCKVYRKEMLSAILGETPPTALFWRADRADRCLRRLTRFHPGLAMTFSSIL